MYFGGWSIHSLALKPADLPLDHNTVILNQGQAEFVDYIAASDPSQQSKEEVVHGSFFLSNHSCRNSCSLRQTLFSPFARMYIKCASLNGHTSHA